MGRMTGSASVEIEAPLEEVWAIVEDVASAPEWQGGLNALEPIEHDHAGRPTLVRTRSDAKVREVTAMVRFDYAGAPTELRWSQVKGDLKALDGAWRLEDLGDGRTRACYELDGDPGRVLGMLIRGPVEGIIRDILVNARPGELKARAEA